MLTFRRPRPEPRGYFDGLTANRVSGWAADRTRPGKRLDLQIYVGGALAGIARADLFREDLARAGIGDGRHGFSLTLAGPEVFPETIAVKIADSGEWLFNTAVTIEPNQPFLNSRNRGFPVLEPGLSSKAVDDFDIAVAHDLQQSFHARSSSSMEQRFAGRDTMWSGIVARRHRRLVELIAGRDPRALAVFLVDIQKHLASEGLMQGEAFYRDILTATPEGRRAAAMPFHDMLASLAQFMGILRAECREQALEGEALSCSTRDLVGRIETALGHRLAPPTIFDGVFGLRVAGDLILHGRDVQALYAALRAIEASGMTQPRLCEIGGGFGKVAYYAWLRGVRRYTIVDLPSVVAMQYFTLRRALPDVPVRISTAADEARGSTAGIDLIPAPDLAAAAIVPADLVLNCDSFPEMGEATCRAYLQVIPAWAPWLLSINQEANREGRHEGDRQIIVGALAGDPPFKRSYRFRSWIRPGFVEELWHTRSDASDPGPHREVT